MTVPRAEAGATIQIDLRANATGPGKLDAGSIDAETLEKLQDQVLAAAGGGGGESRLVGIPRLLVVDDTDAFARHADALLYLLEASTFDRMLCVIVGPPAEPPALEIPAVLEFYRVPVLWAGNPRGVGWRIGRARPDRLAVVSEADPDGARTVADVLDALLVGDVYDKMSEALGELPYRFGVPALLPWARWACDDPPVGPGSPEPAAPGQAAPGQAGQEPSGSQPTSPGPAVAADPAAPAALAPDLVGRRNLIVRFFAWLLGRRRPGPPPGAGPAAQLPGPGPAEPVPEEAGPTQAESVRIDGEVLARARWLMSAGPEDESFRQLSSARQVIMLGADAGQARLVRFAPEVARNLIEAPQPGYGRPPGRDFTAWTDGEIIGVIRVVPVMDGLLRLI